MSKPITLTKEKVLVSETKVETKTIITKKNPIKSEFAIFIHDNNQFYATNGDNIYLPYIKNAKAGEKIVFDKVLLTPTKVGIPYVAGAEVVGEIMKVEAKDKKIIVFKYKSKKNYRVKTGHRQKYTQIKITKLTI